VWRVEGYYETRWPTELYSTQLKVEGIVLKTAWRWGSDRSVVNNPLVEQGRTLLYVSLPSARGSVDGDCMFSPFWGLRQI
jgi:hypothetical protein